MQYERIDEVPIGGYLGRGPAIYYKYYIDELNMEAYFYAFQGMMKDNNQKLASKPNES